MATKKKTSSGIKALVILAWVAALISLCYFFVVNLLIKQNSLAPQNEWAASKDIAWAVFLLALVAGAGGIALMVMSYYERASQNLSSIVDNMRRLLSGQTQNEAILTQVSENLLLSDAVKSIAFREKDQTVLVDAIHQDIQMEKWASAELLINDLATRFGSNEDAVRLRAEMESYKNATLQEKIDKSITRIESLWSIHHYTEAIKQANALIKIFPENERVKNLASETQQKREQHKMELLARWDETVKNNKIDEGVELLEQLDNYLTPTEAAALEESARGVFKAKLHNLGVQFSKYVTEKKWDMALSVGKEIVEEFPNSRMAQEVRDKLSILEQRVANG